MKGTGAAAPEPLLSFFTKKKKQKMVLEGSADVSDFSTFSGKAGVVLGRVRYAIP
ncbi:hypothetical protein VU05_01200 [Desulfobulbus sp. F1]|nr:hypothetical protein [Desulfobulbus sp. F1]